MVKQIIKLPSGEDLEVEVVSDDEAETVDYVVCVPADTPTPFTDNLTAFCCRCGVKVIHRWYAPRIPKKICMACMVEIGEEEMRRNAEAAAPGGAESE